MLKTDKTLLAIAIGGLALRLVSLLAAGGPLASPGGYDDGVYYTSSALLFRGVLPYRDFVFVHPPGVLYFYGLAWSFASARIFAALIGGVSIFLTGRIVARAAGPAGGIVAALLYAVYPEAVGAERSTYLEPVLNLACLAMAYVWLSPHRDRARRPIVAGLLCGAACAVKVLGGIWLLAALASNSRDRFRRDALRFIGAAALSGLLLLAPLALPDLPAFIQQTLSFHSLRPPDGMLDKGGRIAAMFDSGHMATSVLALLTLASMVVLAIRRRASSITREERFFAVAGLLTFAAFLASASYWIEYNAHLAASQCALAGLFFVTVQRLASTPRRLVIAGTLLLVAVLQGPSLRATLNNARARSSELVTIGAAIREHVPASDCVFAFDPTWTLGAGRLPPNGDGAPIVVDTYGAMLLDAVADGSSFPDAGQAFQRPIPQRDVRARLEACRFAILGARGTWQLNAANREWVESHFFCANPEAGELCVRERLARPFSGLALVESGAVEFGEGWYAQEGVDPNPWRWMSGRSLTSLPPVSGPARLQLAFQIPLDDGPPTILIALDGRTLDRFTPDRGEAIRTYDLPASDARRLLEIRTSHTIRPARRGTSPDTRDLGLRLTRILCLPR